MGSQGYGVNEALCPCRRSLSWAKETGDREECQPASTSLRPRWLWKAGSILPSWFLSGFLSELKQPLGNENKEEEAA